MGKRRYKVTLMKYVRDAAGRGVDRDSRRFSFDASGTVSASRNVDHLRAMSIARLENPSDLRTRLGVFDSIKPNGGGLR